MTIKDLFEHELFHVNDFSFKVGNIVLAFAALIINVFIIKIVSKIILKRSALKTDDLGHRFAILQLIKYVLWVITLVVALQTLGINLTILIAGSTALLVGLGLGMQIIFKDFMSGIILLVEGSIKVNDIIEINGQVMIVKKISLRTSEVITRDDNVFIIPNHKFTEENVINWTYNAAPTRFFIEVGVDYASDLALVEKCLLQAVENNNEILKADEYTPFVRFIDFGSSSLNFQLIFWSFNLFRIENTKSSIRFEIARIFKDNNITIPFNQVVVHQS